MIERLTARAGEVLQLLAAGLDSAAIAARLHFSPRTERNHVGNILAKLACIGSRLRAATRVVQVPASPAEV